MIVTNLLQSKDQLIWVDTVGAIIYEVWFERNEKILGEKHLAWRKWFT